MPSIVSFGFVPTLALALLFSFSQPAWSAPAEADPGKDIAYGASGTVHPPYYRIEGRGGATLLIMGTIHLGPSDGWRFSPDLLRGLKESDSFFLEIDLRDVTEEKVSTVLANRVILPTSVTIEEVVSPETAKLLEEHDPLLTQLGLPEGARRRFKPWFLAVKIVEAASAQSGYSGAHSAESVILAGRGDRPLVGLETFDGQLAMFDALSPRHQDLMLNDTLNRLERTVEDIEDLLRAWGRNDEETLEQIAYQGMDDLPELQGFYDILFGERNRNWVRQLSPFLNDPERAGETIFVAVGALHLVGSESVIRLLEAAGFRAEALHPKPAPAS